MLAAAVVFAAGCTKPDDPNNGGNGGGGNNGGGGGNGGGTNNHGYVDLGLPSGTLWATCNVGADTPEGFGDYFAWGETQPKTTYNWSTYKWCNGDRYKLTKYCHDASYGNNGFTDNLTILEASDDAATANWGSGWGMPSREAIDELVQYTTYEKTTVNGVIGMRFTGTNGNSIFMPYAGCRVNNELSYTDYGYYWVNTNLGLTVT